MKKRKKLAEIKAEVAAATRATTIAEACRVLKWHLEEPTLAEELNEAFLSGMKLKQHPPAGAISHYSGFDEIRF